MDAPEKTRELVLGRIEAFLAETKLSERQFGIKSVADPKFVKRLRGGFGVTLTSIEKAETFMAEYVPGCADETASADAEDAA